MNIAVTDSFSYSPRHSHDVANVLALEGKSCAHFYGISPESGQGSCIYMCLLAVVS